MDTVDWISLIMAFIALVAVFLVFVYVWNHQHNLTNNGLALIIQEGVTSGTTDSMKTGGNNLYVARTTATSLNLTIRSNSGNTKGRQIYVTNDLPNGGNVNLTGSGISLKGNPVVSRATTATFVFLETNRALRMS